MNAVRLSVSRLPTSPTVGNLARDIEGSFVGQVGVFPDCVLRVRISRPVSHLEFVYRSMRALGLRPSLC